MDLFLFSFYNCTIFFFFYILINVISVLIDLYSKRSLLQCIIPEISLLVKKDIVISCANLEYEYCSQLRNNGGCLKNGIKKKVYLFLEVLEEMFTFPGQSFVLTR